MMTIKELLIEADAIQVGVTESDWQKVIQLAASPLVAKGYISADYGQAVIDNTLNHGAYYVFDEGVAIPTPGRNVASGATVSAWWC
jgi:PTS system ascorbate-specific IIA component